MTWKLLATSFWLLAVANVVAGGKAKPSTPEDLGPSVIDVSSYPDEYQKTYREIFIKVFSFLGGTARAVNSPIIELDSHLEAQERRDHPELFTDPKLAEISPDGWKKRVEEIYRRPACCGACPVLSRKKARALWRFMVYDSIRRKTGPQAKAWLTQRSELLKEFDKRKQGEIKS